MIDIPQDINSARIAEAIDGLKQYVNDPCIEPLIATLEALENNPGDESLLRDFSKTFHELGIIQGAVLTYAPYLGTIVPLDFGEDS